MNLKCVDYMTGEEYSELRSCVGWKPITKRQAERGIEHTTFLVVIRDGDIAVAMGRLLFDYGYTAYLGDIIVRPEYQRQGIGRKIVETLISKTMNLVHEGEWVMFVLIAGRGKEPFYEKLGFQRRPTEFSGSGMTMIQTK